MDNFADLAGLFGPITAHFDADVRQRLIPGSMARENGKKASDPSATTSKLLSPATSHGCPEIVIEGRV